MSFIFLSASFWGLAEVLDNESVSLFALSVGSLRRRHPLIASGCLSEDVCSVALPSGILQAAAWPGNWGSLHFSTCLWVVNMWAWSRSGQEKPLMKGWWLIGLPSKEFLQAEYRLWAFCPQASFTTTCPCPLLLQLNLEDSQYFLHLPEG